MLRRLFGAAPAAEDTIGVVEAQRIAAQEALLIDVREWTNGRPAMSRAHDISRLAS